MSNMPRRYMLSWSAPISMNRYNTLYISRANRQRATSSPAHRLRRIQPPPVISPMNHRIYRIMYHRNHGTRPKVCRFQHSPGLKYRRKHRSTELYYRIFFDEAIHIAAQPGISEMSVPVDYSDQYGIAFMSSTGQNARLTYMRRYDILHHRSTVILYRRRPTEGNILAQSDIITDAASSSR